MITELAGKVADFFVCRNWVEKDEREIYRYGVEVIMSGAISFCIVLICAIAFQEILYTFLFYAVFLLMRRFCGGYHADTYLKCNLLFAVNVVLVDILLKMSDEVSNYLLFLITISSILLIGTFTPIVNANKSVEPEQQRTYRRIAMGLLVAFVLLEICMILVERAVSVSIALSLFSVALAMLIEKIKTREAKEYENI